jgi:chromosome segregation ATPase
LNVNYAKLASDYEKAESDLLQYTADMQQTNAQLLAYNESVLSVQQSLAEATEEYQEATRSLTSTQLQLKESEGSVETLQQAQCTLARQLEETQANATGLSGELIAAKEQLEASKERITELEQTFSECATERDVARERLEATDRLLNKTQESLDKLQAEYIGATQNLEEANSQVTELVLDQTRIKQLLSDSDKDVSRLEAQVAAMASTNEAQTQKLHVAEEKVFSLEESACTARSMFVDLMACKTQLAIDVENQKKATADAVSANNTMGASLQELRSNLDASLAQLLLMQSQRSAMEVANEAANEKIVELDEQILRQNDVISELNSSLQNLESTSAQTVREISEHFNKVKSQCVLAEQERDAAQELITTLQEQLKTTQLQIVSLEPAFIDKEVLQSEITAINTTLQETMATLESTESELDEVRSELAKSYRKIGHYEDHAAFCAKENEQVVAELKSSLAATEHELSIVQRTRSCALQEKVEAIKEINELSAKLKAARVQLEELSVNAEAFRSDRDGLMAENVQLKDKMSKGYDDLQRCENELVRTRQILASDELRVKELMRANSDLQDELESKAAMLSQDNQSLKQRDQTIEALEDDVEKLHSANRVASARLLDLDKTVKMLESEKVDLTTLLASANECVDEGRQALQAAEDNLRATTSELENAYQCLDEARATGGHASISDNKFEELIHEKETLACTLEKERKERHETDTHLKQLRHDEQRALVREAELSMLQQQNRISRIESDLKRTEAEAYAARESNLTLSDQKDCLQQEVLKLGETLQALKGELTLANQTRDKLIDQEKDVTAKSIQYQSALSALQNENERIKKSINIAEKTKQLSETLLQAELKKVKEELHSVQQTARDREASAQALRQALHTEKLRVASDGPVVRELQDENKHLSAKIREALSKLQLSESQLQESSQRVDELHAKVHELTSTLQLKDKRIEKLETLKLTKEQVMRIKKVQASRSD